MLYLIDAVMDGPELFRVGIQGRKLLLQIPVLRFQTGLFRTPCSSGQLAVHHLSFQLALGHVEQPQLLIMLGLVLLTGFLKADGFQLVGNWLSGFVVIRHAKQLVQLFDAGLFPGCRLFQRVDFSLHGMQSCVQIVSGVEVFGFQIADRLGQLFQIGNPGLAAVRALIAVVIVGGQQLHQRRRLGLGQLRPCLPP